MQAATARPTRLAAVRAISRKAFDDAVVQYMPQQRCKRRERRQVGTGIGRHMRPGAGGPVEHPSWNLKPTVGIGAGQITAENNAARLLDSCVNADPKSIPWMPRVQQFPKLSFVGVSKPRCTTRCVHIPVWTISRRRSSSLTRQHSVPSGNGPGRCGTWGLRAPARCSTVPHGTHRARRDAVSS